MGWGVGGVINQGGWPFQLFAPAFGPMEDCWMGRGFRLSMFEEVAHTKSLHWICLPNIDPEMLCNLKPKLPR